MENLFWDEANDWRSVYRLAVRCYCPQGAKNLSPAHWVTAMSYFNTLPASAGQTVWSAWPEANENSTELEWVWEFFALEGKIKVTKRFMKLLLHNKLPSPLPTQFSIARYLNLQSLTVFYVYFNIRRDPYKIIPSLLLCCGPTYPQLTSLAQETHSAYAMLCAMTDK